MKVKVSEIKPNPFRRIDRYPINREKVEALKKSIDETEFWDNLLGRKNSKGEIEIAYGHHRLVALKELGYEEIDITVKDLDDVRMLQIMGNENLREWDQTTCIINETVLAAKEFIDGELAKGWKDCNESIRVLFDSKHAFDQTLRRAEGAGQSTLLKFLGKNWKQWMIQNALAAISDNNVDREALEQFNSPSHAEAFRQAVNDNKDIFPKDSQGKLASDVKTQLLKKDGELTAAKIKATVKRIANSIRKNDEGPPTDIQELYGLVEDVRKGSQNLTSKLDKFLKAAESVDVEGLCDLVTICESVAKQLTELSGECEKGEQTLSDSNNELIEVKEQGAIKTTELLNVLNILKFGVAKRLIIEEFGHFLFLNDRIIAFNDEFCLSAYFPAGLTGEVNAVDFLKSISGVKGDFVNLSKTKDKLVIKSGEETIEHYLFEPLLQEYVERHMVENGNWRRLPDDLIDALDTVSFSRSRDATRIAATGIFVKNDDVISSDINRASWYKLKAKVPEPFLFPVSKAGSITALNNLRYGPYAIKQYCIGTDVAGNKWIYFKGDKMLFASRLFDRPYPYEDIIAAFSTNSPLLRVTLPADLKKTVDDAFGLIKQDSFERDLKLRLRIMEKSLRLYGTNVRGDIVFKRALKLAHTVDQPFEIWIQAIFLSEALKYSKDMAVPADSDRNLAFFYPPNFQHCVALLQK